MAPAFGLGAFEFGALLAFDGLLGLACLLVDLARFDEALLRLVVVARSGAVPFALVALPGFIAGWLFSSFP